MTWADVFEAEYDGLVGWARTFILPQCDAEEVVQDAFADVLGTSVPDIAPRRFVAQRVKDRHNQRKRRFVRDKNLITLAAPVLLAEGDTHLVSLDRCRRAKQNFVRAQPDENHRGFTLARVPCAVCETPFKPHLVKRTGKRKETCGTPRCVAQLRERRKREAA